ncbi:tRNA-(ms[2]io[6]A)-hydroxylase [Salibacter halophilus]|uniref:tRNA-(Ms[2]io[6]A)-hydroxylase n=1 Tax=Salibacter halophilus TaxID=1803916 RepID=A0A6N6M944_9FLAO|nr:tRNA-(ms[2]io[6]A)-hydroxylase [Salibacter halophilus]KAB1064558.1 tRNA-(ms[2]io[6]A)-hydroxylase [Salibacter halophilus]
MLKLRLPTDPRWVNIAEKNLEEILTDHAYCEQKAASTAISLIVQFPEYTELVSKMSELAQEEMEHFQRVHQIMEKRDIPLGRERKDEYIHELKKYFSNGGRSRLDVLIDKLLFAAMIEARSCERFRVLSENIQDEELADFYHELMKSEAGHYSMFLLLAKKYGDPDDVEERWQKFLDYESDVIAMFGKSERIHG